MPQPHIHIGSDHAGFALRQALIHRLTEAGYALTDHGPASEASVDYPDYAHSVAEAVLAAEAGGTPALGLLMCGSGNGICIAANKHAGIRAALAWAPELASMARQHNNANVLCLPARYIAENMAWDCVQAFLQASFEGGRHQNRIDKLTRLEAQPL